MKKYLTYSFKWMYDEICPKCRNDLIVHYDKKGRIDKAICNNKRCNFRYPVLRLDWESNIL
jgi:hypothetical protein